MDCSLDECHEIIEATGKEVWNLLVHLFPGFSVFQGGLIHKSIRIFFIGDSHPWRSKRLSGGNAISSSCSSHSGRCTLRLAPYIFISLCLE